MHRYAFCVISTLCLSKNTLVLLWFPFQIRSECIGLTILDVYTYFYSGERNMRVVLGLLPRQKRYKRRGRQVCAEPVNAEELRSPIFRLNACRRTWVVRCRWTTLSCFCSQTAVHPTAAPSPLPLLGSAVLFAVQAPTSFCLKPLLCRCRWQVSSRVQHLYILQHLLLKCWFLWFWL
jgi:hypothetical protein